MPSFSVAFLLGSARLARTAAALTRRNLTSGMRKVILRWQTRHIAMDDSPLTEAIPGAAYGVEHSEQVGMKLLTSMSTT
ncbi:hypothetical protein B0A49_05629, partial [Cryomyces minteri]